MKFLTVLGVALFMATGTARLLQEVSEPIVASDTSDVSNLKLSGLMGRWYGVYRSSLLASFVPTYCTAFDLNERPARDTASDAPSAEDESDKEKGKRELTFDWSLFYIRFGEQEQLFGTVKNETAFLPGKLEFSLDKDSHFFEKGDNLALMPNRDRELEFGAYIVALGELANNAEASGDALAQQQEPRQPGEADMIYPWLVVTGPLARNYVILTRDPLLFESQYKLQVFQILQEKGFASQPVAIYQSSMDCNYPAIGTKLHEDQIPAVPGAPEASIGPEAPISPEAPGEPAAPLDPAAPIDPAFGMPGANGGGIYPPPAGGRGAEPAGNKPSKNGGDGVAGSSKPNPAEQHKKPVEKPEKSDTASGKPAPKDIPSDSAAAAAAAEKPESKDIKPAPGRLRF